MSLPAGATVIGGIAVSADGAVYVTPTGTASITGGTAKFDDGLVGTPSIAFAAETNTGFYRSGPGGIAVAAAGVSSVLFGNSFTVLTSGGLFAWSSTAAATGSVDTTVSRQAAGRVAVNASVATPAGGSANLGLVFGSTSGFGIYIGSGVPTLSAAQGSLYLCSNGSSTSTRAYINTNGTTGWTAITTAT